MDGLNEITIDRTGLGETGEIYLVNKDGYMITPSRFVDDAVFKQKVDLEHIGAHEHRDEAVMSKNYLGTDVLRVHRFIPEMEWCLVAEIALKEAPAPITRLTNKMFSILADLLVMGSIFSLLISRKITIPIMRLHHGAEEIMKGNLEYKSGTKARDEIVELSRTFDKMAANLGEKTAELEKKVKETEKQVLLTLNIAQDLEESNKRLNKEIKERKRSEEKLRKSEEKYRLLVENVNDGIVISQRDKFIFFNKHFAEMLVYTHDGLFMKDYREVYTGKSVEILMERKRRRD